MLVWPGRVGVRNGLAVARRDRVSDRVAVGRYCRDWPGAGIDCRNHECIAAGEDIDESIDAPSQLLVTGPFSWSRNPLYVAYVVTLCSCALASGSWLALGCPLLGFGVLNGLIIPIEELRMAEEFGDDYRRYCQQVRRWL